MNWRQYNWLAGCAAVCFTLVVLFGGQLLWKKFAVAQPLDKAFVKIHGVAETSWEEGKNGEPVKIYATLQHVDNLAKTYEDLNAGAKNVLEKKPFKILIRDNRSQELEQFNYKIQYLVQEAISTGRFAAMEEGLKAKAEAEDIDIRIFVSGDNIYLQTAKDTAQMYVVVPRKAESGGDVK